MRKVTYFFVAALPLLAGCAELATGLAAYSDQLSLENGGYYPDEHFSQSTGPDCPALWEYGRVNNQSYARARNTGSTYETITLEWSSGLISSFGLGPGETSQFFYMTPSVLPDGIQVDC